MHNGSYLQPVRSKYDLPIHPFAQRQCRLCGATVVEIDPAPALKHHLHLLQYVVLRVATADDVLPELVKLLPPALGNPRECLPLAR